MRPVPLPASRSPGSAFTHRALPSVAALSTAAKLVVAATPAGSGHARGLSLCAAHSINRPLPSLPPYEGGPGNGQWNLGQYVIARGSDLPLHDLQIEVLPPMTPDEPPKGMAEVVMIPVVPAILNAIFDATGRRFQSLPVTQSMIKGALS